MAEANFGPIPIGLSLSFDCLEDEWMSEVDRGEKLVKSVGKTEFWQHCNFVRSFGSKGEGQAGKGGGSKKGKNREHVSRNNSIASSTGSMNSEVTELSSSQFEPERDIERKSCCLCVLM